MANDLDGVKERPTLLPARMRNQKREREGDGWKKGEAQVTIVVSCSQEEEEEESGRLAGALVVLLLTLNGTFYLM